MKLLKQSSLTGLLIFLCVVINACKDNSHARQENKAIIKLSLDTGKIHNRLKEYDSLNFIEAPEKDVVLKSILNETISMGYNDKACFLLMDAARDHSNHGNFDSSLHYFNLARPYCNKPNFDKTLPAEFLTQLGAFYFSLRSDHVAANKCYYEALSYLKKNGLTDNELTISLYVYLHGTQDNLGHYEQALFYLKEAEKLAAKLNSKKALISIWSTFGVFYFEQKDYEKSGKYYDLALENEKKWREPDWDPNITIAALTGKGYVLTNTGQAKNAIPLFSRALKVAQENNIIYSEVGVKTELAAAYNKLGRFKEAIHLATQALEAQKEAFNWYKEKDFEVLVEAYEALGQYQQALEYQRKLYAWRDSIADVEKNVALNELGIKFQTASKDKEIASKKLLIEQQKNKLSRKNALIGGISMAAVVVVLISIFLYKNISNKQRVQELEIKTLRRQQEIDILKSTMHGEEQERKRMSRELHDGIGSMLSSAIMRLSFLKKHDPKEVSDKEYEGVLHLLQEIGSEVRRTAQNLMPDIIYKQTLYEAVKNYCNTISQGTNINIDVQFYGVKKEFSAHCKLVIYRVIQELVHNIVKHAHATEVIVQGVLNGNNFTVTVEDNGIGFDPDNAQMRLGLKNVASRIKSIYGEFQIDSMPGKGTTAYMEFDCELDKETPSETPASVTSLA